MGYQAQDLTGKAVSSIGATFANVALGEKFTLGDMIPTGFNWNDEFLQVLDTDDAHTIQKFTYITPERALSEWEDPDMKGWWIKDLEGEEGGRADTAQFDSGYGFLGNFVNKSVSFTYSGQVLDGSNEIDATGKRCVMVANFIPVDVRLGSVVADGFNWNDELFQELSEENATTINTYVYITAERAVSEWEDPEMQGWWIKGLEGEDNGRADKVWWKAGKAFLTNCGGKAAKFVFPDPMTYVDPYAE